MKDYNCSNLKFLADLFDQLEMTPVKYARQIGLTGKEMTSEATTLRYHFRNDNITLQKAKRICANLGYRLEVTLEPKEQKNDNYQVQLTIDQRTQDPDKEKHMYFLKEFMKKNKLSYVKMAKDLGLSVNGIRYVLYTDNIYLALLNKIAMFYNARLTFILKPLEQ